MNIARVGTDALQHSLIDVPVIEILWQTATLEMFSIIFLYRYYNEDEDVGCDKELENFTNEVSKDGIGENGGTGMVRIFLESSWNFLSCTKHSCGYI